MPAPKTNLQVLLDHSEPQSNGCILWTGYRDKDGYGKVNRKPIYTAHQLSFAVHGGVVPDGMELDHLCGNPSCVNPVHLEPVIHAVNVQRGDYTVNHRNGRKTRCIRGHELIGLNLIVEVWRGSTKRKCRTCRNDAQRKRHQAKIREVAA